MCVGGLCNLPDKAAIDKASAIARVKEHAAKMRVPLDSYIDKIGTVTTNNPVGFDFTPVKGSTAALLLAIIDSGKFGLDDPGTLIGWAAGCVARASGYAMSWRQISEGESMHIQIGNSKCDVHIDSTGIAPQRARDATTIIDLSRVVEHWERDLRPTLPRPIQMFDIQVLGGHRDSGQGGFGGVLMIKNRFSLGGG